jgi:release factor glutamine methyltransferase
MRILTLPGVFQPRSDTWMLAGVLTAVMPAGARVLDLCTGSGALAVTAAAHGAGEVVAVDVSRRALLSVRANALLRRVRVRAVRGDLFGAVGADERFDVIVSNPPYLPATAARLPSAGLRRAWDAGTDGRALLDRICAQAPAHLRPGGSILLVHSSVCDGSATIAALHAGGLDVEVLARSRGPLGPLLSGRARLLEERGLLARGRREEEMLVIRGLAPPRRPAREPAHAATA